MPAASRPEPRESLCLDCGLPILIAAVFREPKRRRGEFIFIADRAEWEPRAACQSCQIARRRIASAYRRDHNGARPPAIRVECGRCGDSGYVGEHRPPGVLLAWDVGWSDDGHVRLVGPKTPRRKGEAFYRPHACTA